MATSIFLQTSFLTKCMERTTLQCKECFKFIFFRRKKAKKISENRPQNEMPRVSPTGKDSPTGVPRQRSDEHERQLYHCPGHSVLNSTIAPLTAFSTSALRNSWTYQQSVSPGLTPTVTRKWSPLVCNELMKHPWKCTVCTVHCTRHTIACD